MSLAAYLSGGQCRVGLLLRYSHGIVSDRADAASEDRSVFKRDRVKATL